MYWTEIEIECNTRWWRCHLFHRCRSNELREIWSTCETKSVSKQAALILITWSSKNVQSPETMLSRLATFHYIHWVDLTIFATWKQNTQKMNDRAFFDATISMFPIEFSRWLFVLLKFETEVDTVVCYIDLYILMQGAASNIKWHQTITVTNLFPFEVVQSQWQI